MVDFDSLLEKIDEVKREDGTASPRAKSGFASFIVGGIVGTMVGYSKKWNLFYSAIGGAVLGGAIGSIIVPSTKKKQ
jgi:hypothetical protein